MGSDEPAESTLQAAVNRFPVWHYEFDLNGVKTPARSPSSVNRHKERGRHFFTPLVDLAGGFEGKSVLDLGCNAGYWSLQAIQAGAAFVLGIDGREMHIDQANLVFGALNVDAARYRFERVDVFNFDFSSAGVFDVVLCLGLLYHISKPMELFEKISSCNSDLLLTDTRVSLLPGSAFEVEHESLDDPRNAVDFELILVPTRRAVVQMARQFGYTTVVLPVDSVHNFVGMHDYRDGKRASFISAKKTSLSAHPRGDIDLPLHQFHLNINRRMKALEMQLHRRKTLRRNLADS
jgi:SAM-dependent methyltransferase